MKIELDGVSYSISEETLNKAAEQGLEKLDPFLDSLQGPIRILVEQAALMGLQYAEQHLVSLGMPREQAKSIRVKRGENPLIKALCLIIAIGHTVASYAECSIKTHNGEIAAISFRPRGKDTGEIGGQLADTGEKGKWQNYIWQALNS